MQIQVKSASGITLVPLSSTMFSRRTVFIEGSIEHETANDFMKEIMLLTAEDHDSPIHILINSPGGEINSGMLVYDVIQSSVAPLVLYCTGRAYSMAALLFASGNAGRYMLPHSEIMIHEPLLGNNVTGNSSTIKSISDSMWNIRKQMNELFAMHTGRTVSEIEEATGYDHYFDSSESVDFGLCDGVVSFDQVFGRIGL